MALTSTSLLLIERVYKNNAREKFCDTLSGYVNRMRCAYLETDIEDIKDELNENGEVIVYYKSMCDKVTIK